MNWKQKALYLKMSDISEEHYCAGWVSGNEYTLWEMVANPSANRNYGMFPVEDDDIREIKEISDEIGGWIHWADDDFDPQLPAEEWGPRFIPIAEWLPMYERRMTEWASLRGTQPSIEGVSDEDVDH